MFMSIYIYYYQSYPQNLKFAIIVKIPILDSLFLIKFLKFSYLNQNRNCTNREGLSRRYIRGKSIESPILKNR